MSRFSRVLGVYRSLTYFVTRMIRSKHPLARAPMLGALLVSCLAASLHAQATAQTTAQATAQETARGSASSQTPTDRAVMAVVDSAMTFIQSGDMARLSDLMTPEAQVYAASTRDGAPGFRMRTAVSQRALGQRPPIIERGFNADLRVAGTIAVVWLPYDLYVDNKWSHCGVDVFTLVQVATTWRIANLTYSVEQPPACRVHPSGPAAGTTGTPGGSR